ncbi:hypothetical protein JTE90_002559 [Oedothorax gibbosus]|uniref:Uncharacterized protein n=1 Tax=Oedothorax gibbosus TaxID=931172 RepID=A0AAV6V061_9ARAC|nr:hypothetical protein JTE90_002559 [Oedothorax gibbosus]
MISSVSRPRVLYNPSIIFPTLYCGALCPPWAHPTSQSEASISEIWVWHSSYEDYHTTLRRDHDDLHGVIAKLVVCRRTLDFATHGEIAGPCVCHPALPLSSPDLSFRILGMLLPNADVRDLCTD